MIGQTTVHSRAGSGAATRDLVAVVDGRQVFLPGEVQRWKMPWRRHHWATCRRHLQAVSISPPPHRPSASLRRAVGRREVHDSTSSSSHHRPVHRALHRAPTPPTASSPCGEDSVAGGPAATLVNARSPRRPQRYLDTTAATLPPSQPPASHRSGHRLQRAANRT